MNWYLEVLKKYAVFDGRARRMEYWMFSLVSTVVSVAIAFGAGFMGVFLGFSPNVATFLVILYTALVLLPSLGVWVRRLHDTGRSGWWILIVVVPIVGALAMLVFSLQDSEPGTNAYGKNPKTSFA